MGLAGFLLKPGRVIIFCEAFQIIFFLEIPMALSKQLFILISLLFLVIFGVNYITSVTNTRNYLQTEARIHAEDAATSLGVSLQPHIGDHDDTILPTLINAVFDRGYYGSIMLSDLDGNVIVNRQNPKTFAVVPGWFSTILPLETADAASEINDGWNLVAQVTVSVHPGYAYLKLWEQAKRALTYSVLAYLLSIIILAGMLRLVLKPLQKIETQAEAIGNGEFAIVDPLPWTKEIKSVAAAMNLMSEKIKLVINSLQAKLGEAERKLTTDAVTGLETRPNFDAALKQMFVTNKGGHVFLIQIEDLTEIARSRSRDDVDRFLRDFAGCIKSVSGDSADTTIYRLGGAEFAIIAESIDRVHAEHLSKGLSDGFSDLGHQIGVEGIAHIGGIAFDPLGTSDSIVSAARESYNKARLVGLNSFVIGEKSSGARSRDEWIAQVKAVIAQGRADIVFSDRAESLQDPHRERILIEETTARILDEHGEELSIGTFISVAEEIDLVSTFDLMILNKVVDHMNASSDTHDIGVNFSFTSIGDPDFRSQLYGLIDSNREVSSRLVFCLTAYSAAKDLTLLESFTELVRRTGTKLMVKRYGPRHMDLDMLKKFQFDYIRLARSYTEDLEDDSEKQRLVTTMVETGNFIDSTILAESVSDKDWQQVIELGVDGASRKRE